jgi:hypothetical protein
VVDEAKFAKPDRVRGRDIFRNHCIVRRKSNERGNRHGAGHASAVSSSCAAFSRISAGSEKHPRESAHSPPRGSRCGQAAGFRSEIESAERGRVAPAAIVDGIAPGNRGLFDLEECCHAVGVM